MAFHGGQDPQADLVWSPWGGLTRFRGLCLPMGSFPWAASSGGRAGSMTAGVSRSHGSGGAAWLPAQYVSVEAYLPHSWRMPTWGSIHGHWANALGKPLFPHEELDIPAVEFSAVGSESVKIRNHFLGHLSRKRGLRDWKLWRVYGVRAVVLMSALSGAPLQPDASLFPFYKCVGGHSSIHTYTCLYSFNLPMVA